MSRQTRKTSKTKTPQTATARVSKTARRAVYGVVKSVSARVLPALPHDAVKLLEKDHRRFERLMEEGEETTVRARKRRKDVLSTLAAEIVAHERKEEKVLYPALKRHSEARDIVLEGYQEHHVADVLLGELKNMDPADERWGAKFKVLKESLEHHIEEEERHMFRTARSVLGRDRLEELGRRMETLNGSRMNGKTKKPAR
jgi:hemerythrin-like domain-containing protein